jgi:hypothetical protein
MPAFIRFLRVKSFYGQGARIYTVFVLLIPPQLHSPKCFHCILPPSPPPHPLNPASFQNRELGTCLYSIVRRSASNRHLLATPVPMSSVRGNTTVHKTKQICVFSRNCMLFMKYALDSRKVNGSSSVRIILFWNCPVNQNV